MSKRKKHTPPSIKDILKGKFLVEDNAIGNWKFLVFVVFLAFLMITSAHFVDKTVVNLNQKKEQLDEVKAKYALMQSKLIQMKLESELANQVIHDSLVSLEEHPIKILVE